MTSPTKSMRTRIVQCAALGIAVVLVAGTPRIVDAQGLVKGVEKGAREGNKAAGPVGGVLGGAIGGVALAELETGAELAGETGRGLHSHPRPGRAGPDRVPPQRPASRRRHDCQRRGRPGQHRAAVPHALDGVGPRPAPGGQPGRPPRRPPPVGCLGSLRPVRAGAGIPGDRGRPVRLALAAGDRDAYQEGGVAEVEQVAATNQVALAGLRRAALPRPGRRRRRDAARRRGCRRRPAPARSSSPSPARRQPSPSPGEDNHQPAARLLDKRRPFASLAGIVIPSARAAISRTMAATGTPA